MPIIKSAVKRVRVSEKRYARNTLLKKRIRTEVKALEAAITSKDKAKTKKQLSAVSSVYDTAVKKHLITKNTAARKKSRYSRLASEVIGKTTAKKPTAAKAAAKKPAAKPAKSTA